MPQIYFLERILKDLSQHLFFISYLFTRTFIYKITRAMKTKLTLVMEDDVIYNAKKYAKKAETSLSSMVENYLKAVAIEKKGTKLNKSNTIKKLNPKVAKLKGVLHVPKDFNYKEALGQILLERYNKLK